MSAHIPELSSFQPLDFDGLNRQRYLRVLAERAERNSDCGRDLFVGVFFDGTNNNRDRDKPEYSQSNIARLHDAFPDRRQGGFVRIYAPGVGTRFDAIGDSGEGDDLVWGETDRRRGLAFAEKGEARIVWALLTVMDQLHRYFVLSEFLSDREITRLSNDLTSANIPLWRLALSPSGAVLQHWMFKRRAIDNERNRVLGDLCAELGRRIDAVRPRRPLPHEHGIRLSVFGFSRGAAQARVFANWFLDMCRAASGSATLGGLTVDFDFLGLFDTVASVGLANSTLIADGHMEWADAERNLRIPAEVRRCVHLVAAHEVRRSFPLDSISVGGVLDARHLEVVYPGVHSDVGGGYRPTEQGRGTDPQGADLLSRLPLAHMYREARLANVPLNVYGKGVACEAKAAMEVAPSTIATFNAYLAECRVKSGRLADIIDEQYRLYVRWRRLRLDSMARVASVQRAAAQDRTDLLEANRELGEEARLLAAPLVTPDPDAFAVPQVTALKIVTRVPEVVYKRGIEPGRHAEWRRLERSWNDPAHLAPAVVQLFDDWVHDSRAWFKPLGEDDHIWEARQRRRMLDLEGRELVSSWQAHVPRNLPEDDPRHPRRQKAALEDYQRRARAAGHPGIRIFGAGTRPLDENERQELEAWRRDGSLPTQKSGREPFQLGAGYLRYRRVYAGTDANIVMASVPQRQTAVA